jgi:hypothetical protein
MNDLETRLRALPPRKPSNNLDSRVLVERPEPSFNLPLIRRGIPLWLAALGYVAGRFLFGEDGWPTTAILTAFVFTVAAAWECIMIFRYLVSRLDSFEFSIERFL